MKVIALRADGSGCGFYRMYEPARAVRALDPSVDIKVDKWIDVEATENRRTGWVEVSEVTEDADLIISQRPTTQRIFATLEQAHKQGIPIIVELDDDLELLQEDHRAVKLVDPVRSPLENYEWLKKSALLADAMTVSTPALARYKPGGPAYVVPNMLPASIFDIVGRERDNTTVGWTGTLQTHPGDLEQVGGQVAKAAQRYGADVFIVGDGVGVRKALRLPGSVKMSPSGWVPLEDYYQTVADNIDVGVVPLRRNKFNNAKSCLKLMEMSALGIPTVASATPDNQRLHEYGVGKLAWDSADFGGPLKRWLADESTRLEDGQRYREIVQEHFVIDNNAHLWLDVWARVIEDKKAGK